MQRLTGDDVEQFKKKYNFAFYYEFILRDGCTFQEGEISKRHTSLNFKERFDVSLYLMMNEVKDQNYLDFIGSKEQDFQNFFKSKLLKIGKNVPMIAIRQKTKDIQNKAKQEIELLKQEYTDFLKGLKVNQCENPILVLNEGQHGIGDIYVLEDKGQVDRNFVITEITLRMDNLSNNEYEINFDYVVYEKGFEGFNYKVKYNKENEQYLMNASSDRYLNETYLVYPENGRCALSI